MRCKIYIFLFVISGSLTLEAQQSLSRISLFADIQTYYNPAANGNREVLAANFFYRQQWVGMPGAPSTQVFSVHAPLRKPKVALGVMAEHEAVGGNGYTGVHISYAYRLSLRNSKLSFGLRAGITNVALENLKFPDEDIDPAFSEDNMQHWMPNFGFGVLYYTKQYWASFSIPQIFGYDALKNTLDPNIAKREYFLSGGGYFRFNTDWGVEPSLLYVYCPKATASLETQRFAINISGVYKDKYKAGLGYNSANTLVLLLAMDINPQFGFGYSYDLDFGGSQLNGESSGSHEIHIHYKFGYKVNASNPRGF